MSGDGVLLDSVILIDDFNAITRAEVLTAFSGADVPVARALLDTSLESIDFDVM